jgi:heterotetrameric sarcosine oxidase gamma subunit
LKDILAGLASCADQPWPAVIIEGPKARQVWPRERRWISIRAFCRGQCAVTDGAWGVHLAIVADAFEVSVFRGFSESFWEWLTEQAEEFGYQVQ